jgi:hypothetical protein
VVRPLWIPALLVGLAFPADSQSAPSPVFHNYPYLLRISRVVAHLDTCVLLRQDGGYHLERDHDDATDVYEGSLSPDELSRLEQWLENEQLRKLTTEQIMTPLVITSVENLQINIFRGDHWQNLVFPSSESQLPFHEALEPLLEWFKTLHNAPHQTIPEDSGKNNCLTPRRIELKTRPAASAQAPAPATAGDVTQASTDVQELQDGIVPSIGSQTGQTTPPPARRVSPAQDDVKFSTGEKPPAFLVRFEYIRFTGREAERTCAIVYTAGRYHVEKSSQEVGRQIKGQVYEATLELADLQGLRQLLDDPDLKALEHGNIPDGVTYSATDITTAWIPRDKKVQHLGFAGDLRVQAAIGSHYVVNDKNTRLIRPLQKWVKTELRADKTNLVAGATPNQCAPK